MSWILTTDEITRLQVELTNYCNAGCPHCARVNYLSSDWLQGYREKSPYPVSINSTHLSLERYKQMIDNDQWQSLRDVHYCGNYDEPTIHPQIFEFKVATAMNLLNDSAKKKRAQIQLKMFPIAWKLSRVGQICFQNFFLIF